MLVEAKRHEYMDELVVVDPRELMNLELGKWRKIVVVINSEKQDRVYRDGPTCKYKWSTLQSDFKKIWYFHKKTGRNSKEYFVISVPERCEYKVPKTFF